MRVISGTLAVLMILIGLSTAQEQSVRPGINDSFEEPVLSEWVERFEREGREVFDKRHEVVELCELSPGMIVADVGAGTGLFTRLFAEAVGSTGRVYAVDITDEFVDEIVERANEKGISQIEGVVCDSDDAKLAPNSVDVVYICDTYHHFEFPFKTMTSILKALKPDGRLVVVDFHRIPGTSSDWILGHVRAGKDEVRKEVESVGFKLIEDEPDVLSENYILVFGR